MARSWSEAGQRSLFQPPGCIEKAKGSIAEKERETERVGPEGEKEKEGGDGKQEGK